MTDRVAIVGVGHAGFAPITAGVSYRELTFEAALRAYDDAGIDARKDVDSFVAVSEDFCVVLVLADTDRARDLTDAPV